SFFSIGWIARRMQGAEVARWSILILAVQPATFVASAFGFPDAPLLLFWSLAMVFLVKLLESRRGAWWLAGGAAWGAALLSKYTACFFAGGVFLYLLLTPRDRVWLKTPWPYAGAIVALLVFAPVFYWNATHDWASFKFQSVNRFQHTEGLRLIGGLKFLGGRWGGLLPPPLPLAAAAVVLALPRRSMEDRLLLCLSLPMILFFLGVGFLRPTHLFWPLPAYLSLTLMMGEAV